MVLFVAKHRSGLQMLSSYTRAMGRFVDIVWYDLSVTFAMGRLHPYFDYEKLHMAYIRDRQTTASVDELLEMTLSWESPPL